MTMPGDMQSITSSDTQPHFRSAVLDDALLAEAVTVLRNIVAAIPTPGIEGANPSAAVGSAGHALFIGYASQSELFEGERTSLSELMMAHLQASVDGLQEITNIPFLFEGFPGVAWVANHLCLRGFMEDGEDLCVAVDEALLDWLKNGAASSMSCELIGGLAGLGLYGLGRWHTEAGREIVRLVVEALSASAIEHQGLRTWFNTADEFSDPEERQAQGCFNLGLSHGVPGALVFLSKAGALGLKEAENLARSAGAWLLLQRRSYPNGSSFTRRFMADPSEDTEGSRLSWCYGDLGISAAMMVSATALKCADWHEAALHLARAAASREEATVMDGGLCHGAFGNAHIFHRFFRATGEECFLQASRRWLKEGFALRRPGQGLAGFLAWEPGMSDIPVENPWQPESGYLEGISGIGLALLGFLSASEPDWDQLLMVDIPSARA